MKHVALTAALLMTAPLLGGCFDSLIGAPCAAGYALVEGRCVAAAELPDAGIDEPPPPPDAELVEELPPTPEGLSPDVPVCTQPKLTCGGACRDVATDPAHCGACDRPCASGTCSAGQCVP
ncbi:MAG: hypothetical protein M3680_14670 [Myxococcota bacterium]|nr:hypothetical protein [Myxococcota bacterium]